MLRFFHQLGSPKHFYRIAGLWIPWLAGVCAILMMIGLYQGMVVAPPDYQQGDSYRLIYIHVPAAWMSLFVYVVMAAAGAIGLVWHMKMAEVIAISSAPIGASFTFLALVTGSIWGKPMWGTWWVWDARLTSELILLFLYLGVIALYSAIEDKRTAARATFLVMITRGWSRNTRVRSGRFSFRERWAGRRRCLEMISARLSLSRRRARGSSNAAPLTF